MKGPGGLEDASQAGTLFFWLEKMGMSRRERELVARENFLRVLGMTWDLQKRTAVLYWGERTAKRRKTSCGDGSTAAVLPATGRGNCPWGYAEEDPRCRLLKERIADAVEGAYQEGFQHFLCGMAMGCDLYFCEAVLELRSRHPDVTVEAAIPCPTQADAWPADQPGAVPAPWCQACDFETVVSQQYSASCMQRRDRYMVDHARAADRRF